MQIEKLNSTQVSDLFFNFEKPTLQNYIDVTDHPDIYSDEARQAVRQDAKSFCDIVGGQVDSADLTADFYSRI